MSKPATTARRRATRAKHKAKMRKRAQQRARMEAARATQKAQGCSTGAGVMRDENLNEAPQAATASEEPLNSTEVAEANSAEGTEQLEEHTEAETVTEIVQTVAEPGTGLPVQAEPGVAPAAIQEPIDDSH